MLKKTGTLYVVATPIGNLQDITLRALEILKKIDLIVAEDTRHTAKLLKHFSISKPSISMHDYNEQNRIALLLEQLREGKHIALLSDAGTPLISDPGYHLIREVKNHDIEVTPIPGPCAAIAALSVAGLPTDRFIFEGFLPAKNQARVDRLTYLANEPRTIVFYEAPHRLLTALKDMANIFGIKRKVVIARELTKLHESIVTNDLGEIITYLQARPTEQRGEIVILVEGNKQPMQANQMESARILDLLLLELSVKQAVVLASKITGESKNLLYKIAITKKETK